MGARDALAKELYSRVFETIVVLSNEATRTKTTRDSSNNVIIGMLDLFGFEFYGTLNLEISRTVVSEGGSRLTELASTRDIGEKWC
jgi:hypothetical protein